LNRIRADAVDDRTNFVEIIENLDGAAFPCNMGIPVPSELLEMSKQAADRKLSARSRAHFKQ
jgi:hypothetical protein